MLRLLLLTLFLTVTALKDLNDPPEGSADYDTDDEQDDEIDGTSSGTGFLKNEGFEKHDKSSADDDGITTIIIIAAVSVVALAIIAVLAVLLFRRHLKNREQGVYDVPAEQGQKEAI
ncbi:uncharacterized protein [Salminus brasiliensis]|uniref:uncharacterized protein n=1 Tax=Salminus brasiliensis TaxID=930266 RepID=UPI003B834542